MPAGRTLDRYTSSAAGREDKMSSILRLRARHNCENIPVIPAWIVRRNLSDPRRIPYLLILKDDRHSGEIKEAVRMARYVETSNSRVTDDHLELKRTDGSATVLRIAWRMLRRNGRRALLIVCSYCNKPRRYVYGWEWDSSSGWSNRVKQINWRCRSCARLRYSSEGGYLRLTGLGRLEQLEVTLRAYGSLPRPELWLPHIFTSIDDPTSSHQRISNLSLAMKRIITTQMRKRPTSSASSLMRRLNGSSLRRRRMPLTAVNCEWYLWPSCWMNRAGCS